MSAGRPWSGLTPRRWQPEALSAVLGAWGRGTANPLVHACTGSGKSKLLAEIAASGRGRVLVTTPTQLLVDDLAASIATRCPGEVGRAYQHAWEADRRVVVTCNASLPALLDQQAEWAVWLADEAHRMEGEVSRVASARIVRRFAAGFTATPFRADRLGLETWDELVYSYTSGQAVRDGVLVPWRCERWDGVGSGDVDELCIGWARAADGPGILSAVSIADAETFARKLVDAGVPAEPIHQRLSAGERKLRLRRLQAGRTKALVHVVLLSEGVDLPWLRWLALRRPVGSPVRLVQEVGRVLRAHPGKREAVLYDPHDLLGELGLVHAAALEDAQRGEGIGTPEADPWSIPELEGLDEVSRLPRAKAVQAIEGWVTDVLGQLRLHGVAPPPGQYEGGKWRQGRSSAKQRRALDGLSWAARYLPDHAHRRAVRWVLEQETTRSGTASDLIDILRALADATKGARAGGPKYDLPCAVPGVRLPAEVA